MTILKSLQGLTLALLGGLLWGGPTETPAAGPGAPAPVQADLVPAVALAHRAERLKASFLSGDPSKVQSAATEVEYLRRSFGTLDVTPLVEAMALWARDLGSRGQTDLALQVVREVESRWAPRNPTLLGTRIILHRQSGLQGYFLSLPDIWELTKLRLAHPAHRWLWIVQHAAWLRMMATLLLWGWALSLVLRYRRVLRYLWEEPLSKRGFGALGMALIGSFLLALPVVLGLDPSVAALLGLVLLAPFLSSSEVRITYVVVFLQFVHPTLALLDPLASYIPQPSVVSLQLQPQVRTLGEEGLRNLTQEDRSYLQGWRQLRDQDWVAAEATFDSLVSTHPDKGQVLNNRGVARYQQGKVTEAEQDFTAAYGLLPFSPEVLLNQSVIAFRHLDSATGISKQDEARKLAPEVVDGLMAANQSRTDQRTFALPMPDSPERSRRLSPAQPGRPGMEALLGTPPVLAWVIFPLVALAVFTMRLRRSITQAHPTQCARCGDPFHTTDSPDHGICSKCHHLFVLKDGLHGETRKRKVEEVGVFQNAQRRLHRIFLVILPGADLCFLGKSRQGFVELAVLCFAFGVVFATGRSVRYPGELTQDPTSTWLPLGILLLAVLFLRSWLKLLPRRA